MKNPPETVVKGPLEPEADRVVITGLGMITALGPSAQESWRRCRRGDSGIGNLRRFDVTDHGCQAAGEVEDSTLKPQLRFPKNQKFMSRGVLCAVQAAKEAVSQSRIDLSQVDPFRFAVYTGSGQTGLESSEFFPALSMAWSDGLEHDFKHLGGRSSRLIDRYFSLRTLSNAGLAFLSIELGAQGPSNNLVQSDTASALAIQSAYHALTEDRCDLAVAGGYDSLLNESTFLAYDRAGLLSHLPAGEALRPFDRGRDGLVLGEGAAFVVMERAGDARRRGARILAEVAGVTCFLDTADSPEPEQVGPAARAAILEAMGERRPRFIVARGISTVAGDRVEAQLLSSTIGRDVPVTALKGQVGYLGAATVAVELAFSCMALTERIIPPIAHLNAPDDHIDLDLVLGKARTCNDPSSSVLCLSRSWGGQHSAIFLRDVCQPEALTEVAPSHRMPVESGVDV